MGSGGVILLDTHAWVWWVGAPDRLPAAARRRIDDTVAEEGTLAISAISVWEVAMLVQRERLTLTLDVSTWLDRNAALQVLRFVPVDNAVALRAVQLSDFPHRDPADRIIAATALGLGATLITADQRLHAWGGVPVLWE